MSRIPNELWRDIGLKLDSLADRIRFRAVCKSWTSLLPELPWLMLSLPGEEEYPDRRKFLSPYPPDEDEEEEPSWLTVLGADFDIHIPPRGFVSLGDQNINYMSLDEIYKARCVGSTGNWLITTHTDQTIQLFNPFSRSRFYLPPAMAFEYNINRTGNCEAIDRVVPGEGIRDNFIWKAVLSAPPRDSDGRDCVAMALHHNWLILAIARPGDTSWTTVHPADAPLHKQLHIEDMIFYNHHFYAIDDIGRLIVCNVMDSYPPTLSYVTTNSVFDKKIPEKKLYLVECSGELLMVIKFVDDFERFSLYHTNQFEVYKFDFTDIEFKELKTLGDHSLFLGDNTSVSVRASNYFGRVNKNSIYFTDDYTLGYRGDLMAGGHDMGVFDLEDKRIIPHYKGVSLSYYSPPIWIVPTLSFSSASARLPVP